MLRLPLVVLSLLLLVACGGSEPAADAPAAPAEEAAKPEAAAPAAAKAPASEAVAGELVDATVTVGCASCQLEMEGAKGCNWAIDIGGTAYPVEGPVPHDHDSHADDGMCNTKRKAVVAGAVKDGTFVASRFELLPHDGAAAAEGHGHKH